MNYDNDLSWLKLYYKKYSRAIIREITLDLMVLMKRTILEAREKNKKMIFCGNGASNTIASHAALDFLNQTGIKTLAIDGAPFLTAAANDFGYDSVFERAINLYAEEGDIIVLISSSGNSENVIKAALKAKEKNCFVMTFTGFNHNNKLNKLGDANFWVNSNSYNMVESIHNNWLVTICDLIVKDELHKVGKHGIEF